MAIQSRVFGKDFTCQECVCMISKRNALTANGESVDDCLMDLAFMNYQIKKKINSKNGWGSMDPLKSIAFLRHDQRQTLRSK